MKAVDLFAGAGGLSLGLAQAGVEVELAVEFQPDFASTYRTNHPDTTMICDDIAAVRFDDTIRAMGLTGTIDLVCGGPPCQGFSTVGKKDQHDPRNSLFHEFLRAVDEIEPRAVLFENVSGFYRMYQGIIFGELVRELESRAYTIDSRILDAVEYGLPQYRKRTVIIAVRDCPAIIWPAPTHGSTAGLFSGNTQQLCLNDAISDLPSLCVGGSSAEYATTPQNEYQRILRGDAHRLTEHNCAKYGDRMQEILELIPARGSVNDLPERLRPKGYFANTYARLTADQPSPTITRNFGTPSSSRCVHPTQNRALSTREGARLQGFPDSYQFVGSKTSKNLQIGNAVPPILGRVLGESLVRAFASDPAVQAV